MRPPTMTFPKTSQGPQKSMTTAPSEIRKATGTIPSAGGLSLLGALAAVPTALDDLEDSASAWEANENGKGIAAIKLSAADFLSNSLRFIWNLLVAFVPLDWMLGDWQNRESDPGLLIRRRSASMVSGDSSCQVLGSNYRRRSVLP